MEMEQGMKVMVFGTRNLSIGLVSRAPSVPSFWAIGIVTLSWFKAT